jgi:hypothetical protein
VHQTNGFSFPPKGERRDFLRCLCAILLTRTLDAEFAISMDGERNFCARAAIRIPCCATQELGGVTSARLIAIAAGSAHGIAACQKSGNGQ